MHEDFPDPVWPYVKNPASTPKNKDETTGESSLKISDGGQSSKVPENLKIDVTFSPEVIERPSSVIFMTPKNYEYSLVTIFDWPNFAEDFRK